MEEGITTLNRNMTHKEIKAIMQKCLDKAEIRYIGSEDGRKYFRENIRPEVIKHFHEAAKKLGIELYPKCPWCGQSI